MTDQLATPASHDAQEIERIKAENEERIKGFQRLLAGEQESKKALERQLRELKTAGLSEEERAQLQENETAQRIKELEVQLELAQLGNEFGDEMPLFQELLSAQTARDQLELVRKIRAGTTAAPASTTPAIPGVIGNNPQRDYGAALAADGGPMNDQIADEILKRAPKLSQLR